MRGRGSVSVTMMRRNDQGHLFFSIRASLLSHRQKQKNAPELELVKDRRLSGGIETDLFVSLVDVRAGEKEFHKLVRRAKRKKEKKG